jgi:TonB family protein
MIRRSHILSVLLIAGTLTAVAQPARRGFIPSLFTLPAAGQDIRYSSSAQPVFTTPVYPVVEMQQGIEGACEIELYVTSEGEVVYAELTVSSGRRNFDDAALTCAMKARFPEGYATLDGIPHDCTVTVPYYFLLAEDPEGYWHTRLELNRVQAQYEAVMAKFEDLLLSRTSASQAKMKEIQGRMEERVSAAKQLHRILAEKKELAILRIREAIDASSEQSRPIADTDDAWRTAGGANASVSVAYTGSSVTTVVSSRLKGVERLEHELEMKKSYL